MCNAFGLNHPLTIISQRFAERSVPVLFPNGAPNLEPRPRIAITEPAPIVRARPLEEGKAGGEGFELVSLRWGFKPSSPYGGGRRPSKRPETPTSAQLIPLAPDGRILAG